jgi:hypothetical protein
MLLISTSQIDLAVITLDDNTYTCSPNHSQDSLIVALLKLLAKMISAR